MWGEWDKPYMTLDPAYEAAQLRVFGRMVARGHIYRGRKPVHWSPSSQTALAEAVSTVADWVSASLSASRQAGLLVLCIMSAQAHSMHEGTFTGGRKQAHSMHEGTFTGGRKLVH